MHGGSTPLRRCRMRKLVLGLVGAAALSMGTTANADVIITPGTTVGIPAGFNDFTTDLNALGLFYVTTTGATLTLTQGSVITFEVLGTESGYFDTFTAGPVSYTEMTGSLVNMFASPTRDWRGFLGCRQPGGHPELLEQLRRQCHGWSGRLRHLPGIEQRQPGADERLLHRLRRPDHWRGRQPR